MLNEFILTRASYALELVDELTLGPLVGQSAVATSVPETQALHVFQSKPTRWVFENLQIDTTIDITAQYYLPISLVTGSTAPAVPTASQPGMLHEVLMKPAAGYPFPAGLTRLIGEVKLDPSLDPREPLVAYVVVQIIPNHNGVEPDGSSSPPFTFVTATNAAGQYVAWFFPEPEVDPTLPTGYRVSVLATVDVNGIPTDVQGELPLTTLTQQTLNAAQTLRLTPV